MDAPERQGRPLSTIDNLRALIDGYGVSVSFNQMTHRAEVTIPWVEASAENGDLSALAHVRSLCRQNRMPVSEVGAYLLAIADSRSRHPVLEWIEVTPWDGVDRFDDLCATIPFGGDSARIAFSRLLLRKWMLSACKGLTPPRGLDFPFCAGGVPRPQGAERRAGSAGCAHSTARCRTASG